MNKNFSFLYCYKEIKENKRPEGGQSFAGAALANKHRGGWARPFVYLNPVAGFLLPANFKGQFLEILSLPENFTCSGIPSGQRPGVQRLFPTI